MQEPSQMLGDSAERRAAKGGVKHGASAHHNESLVHKSAQFFDSAACLGVI